jgi:hypothetical protein
LADQRSDRHEIDVGRSRYEAVYFDNPYKISYGGSFLFVVAEDEAQARELAKTARINKYGFSPTDELLGDVKLGKPRIQDLPYAECYHWEE